MIKAQKYYDLMPEGVFSIGRAGSYRYLVDIDDCIEQAFEIVRILSEENGKTKHPVPLKRGQVIEDLNPNLE